jgi:hypothetical protein
VTDPDNASGTANVAIVVGNTAPTVSITTPGSGQLFSYGSAVPFSISVTDPEDGTVDCAKVKMTYVLGHDSHGHQITSVNGCSGTITIPVDGEHDAAANVFAVFDAEYTDKGGLTTHKQHILQPRKRQAEHYTKSSGVTQVSKTQAEGGRTVGDIHNGDWIAFEPYRLDNVTQFSARVSSKGAGGTLEVRAGSAAGTVLGAATVTSTGSWETFVDVTGSIAAPPWGTTTLYLTFTGGSGALFDVDSFTLTPSSGVRTGQIVGLAGKCLDVAAAATADGTKIQLYTCNSTAAQQWTVTPDGPIRAFGKCLDVAGAGTANDTKVQLYGCNSSAGQVWVAQPDGGLRNPNSNKCLDVSGNNPADGRQIVIWDCHTGANQRWILP